VGIYETESSPVLLWVQELIRSKRSRRASPSGERHAPANRQSARTFCEPAVWPNWRSLRIASRRLLPGRTPMAWRSIRDLPPFHPANIAEDFQHRQKADRARYMNIAECSVEQCRYFAAGSLPATCIASGYRHRAARDQRGNSVPISRSIRRMAMWRADREDMPGRQRVAAPGEPACRTRFSAIQCR
jgi:hypothetical protein